MGYRERTGRTPLIPNSLWSKTSFTTICIMVMLSWAGLNSMEFFFSLLCVLPPSPQVESDPSNR